MEAYDRVTKSAEYSGVTRVEALEQIREWMNGVAWAAEQTATSIGRVTVDAADNLCAIYAASVLGGITCACALAGHDLTDAEAQDVLMRISQLYTEMMSDELMRACEAGDATSPLEAIE